MSRWVKHKNLPIHGRINKMLYILSPSTGFEQENMGERRSWRLWGHWGKSKDSYRLRKLFGHQTQGHAAVCQRAVNFFPSPPSFQDMGRWPLHKKEGVWLRFSNGGQLSPKGCHPKRSGGRMSCHVRRWHLCTPGFQRSTGTLSGTSLLSPPHVLLEFLLLAVKLRNKDFLEQIEFSPLFFEVECENVVLSLPQNIRRGEIQSHAQKRSW